MTQKVKGERRALDTTTGNSVISRSLEPGDLEAAKNVPHGIRVDRSFATDY